MPNTDDLKGRAKEAAGDLTDDDDLKEEGRADRAAGAVKDKVGAVEDKVEDANRHGQGEGAPRLTRARN